MEKTVTGNRTKRRRTATQKTKRRERECGPWPCPFCSRNPFRSVSGLRSQVIVEHQQHCLCSRKVRPFSDAATAQKARDAVRQYRRGLVNRTATIPTTTIEKVTAIDGTGKLAIVWRLLKLEFVEPLPGSISVNSEGPCLDADFVTSLDERFCDLSNPMELPETAASANGINSAREDGTLELSSAEAAETGYSPMG
jgi:hypothetical protein